MEATLLPPRVRLQAAGSAHLVVGPMCPLRRRREWTVGDGRPNSRRRVPGACVLGLLEALIVLPGQAFTDGIIALRLRLIRADATASGHWAQVRSGSSRPMTTEEVKKANPDMQAGPGLSRGDL